MSNSVELKARACVKVTINLRVDGVWGSDFTIAQIQEQAKREALASLTRLLKSHGSIVGDPSVIITITENIR